MRLRVDGQPMQRKTGTDDPERAAEMLEEWKAEVKAGAGAETRLRYEAMRDEYIQKGGKAVQESILRDLNMFFKNIRISAITVKKLDDFRKWRESLPQVVEYRDETLVKEIALRKLKAGKKLSQTDEAKIETEATTWVDNGVKATTNRRLTVLRAMFNFLVKRGTIQKTDVPAFPMANNVDNKRRGFLDEGDMVKLLKLIPGYLHAFLRFLYATGMRSGQAAKLTWGMIDKKVTELHVPGELTKNGEDFTLPLVYRDGTPMFDFVKDLKRLVRQPDNQAIFDTTDFRSQWRQACAKLGLGIYNPDTQMYRGLRPHDFRRTAYRNMIRAGIHPQVAMAITGHKTDSMARRYSIVDSRLVQDAFAVLHGK
ncbi:MAG TPA: site-specific integrase [Candidatus Acidoferrum sp.]|nr:site-specific integrase [Candidatus Acidoferrum sp.]